MQVNGKDYFYKRNRTISELLNELKYTYPDLMVLVNGEVISKENFDIIMLKEKDKVKIIHPIVGG